MCNKGNAKALNEYNSSKKEVTKKRVLEAINEIHKSGKKFTLAAVCKKANVSRAYFTKHPDMMEIVNRYRKNHYSCKNRNSDSRDTLIQLQKKTITSLEKRIKELETNINYKEKYLENQERIRELERQINDLLYSNIENELDF